MILSVDLGTSALKAGLISFEGKLISSCRISYWQEFGARLEDFDPQYWVLAFQQALKILKPVRVSVVALSGNGPTLVPMDHRCRPAASANLWLLQRAVYRSGAHSYYLPKALWFQENGGDIWERTKFFLSCPEYLHFYLTKKKIMVLPNESFRSYLWDEKQLSLYGLEADYFPPLVLMGQIAGCVSPEISAETGLAEGTPVVAVGSDFMASMLGSGAITPGMVCDRTGTSEGINCCSLVPSRDPRLRDLPHAIEPYWNTAAIFSSTGALFEEYRQSTGQGNDSYEKIFTAITQAPTGTRQPLYYFPRKEKEGQWEFSKGKFLGLEPRYEFHEKGRAVMESIGFALCRGLEILEESGLKITEMRVTGGQALGHLWNQMKANITGRRLLIPEIEDAELTGGACAAAVALGRFDTLTQASRKIVRIKKIYEPQPRIKEQYDNAYGQYNKMAREQRTLI